MCLVYRAKISEVVVFTKAPLVSLLLVELGSFELIMKIYTNLQVLFFVDASYILICPIGLTGMRLDVSIYSAKLYISPVP